MERGDDDQLRQSLEAAAKPLPRGIGEIGSRAAIARERFGALTCSARSRHSSRPCRHSARCEDASHSSPSSTSTALAYRWRASAASAASTARASTERWAAGSVVRVD